MTRKRLRLGLVGLVALALVAAAAMMAGVFGSSGSSSQAVMVEAETPPALAQHLAKLRQALPPNGGMALEGPGGAAGGEFAERAYPDSTISVAEMEGARDAFAAATSRSGGGNDARWEQIGPSRALYPSSAVPELVPVRTERVRGRWADDLDRDRGRLLPGNACEGYITPAGGGVWHTSNLLSPNVKWHYRGGPLGINAAGAVTIDPHDSSDHTVYVGTGEANICGSGCVAGTGLYRSTNQGQTWTQLGKTEFQGKGIGKIVVHPEQQEHPLRRLDDRARRHELRVLHGRDPADPRDRQVGPVQEHRPGRVVELHPQRLRLDGPAAPAT